MHAVASLQGRNFDGNSAKHCDNAQSGVIANVRLQPIGRPRLIPVPTLPANVVSVRKAGACREGSRLTSGCRARGSWVSCNNEGSVYV
jgi:hypothetical protein